MVQKNRVNNKKGENNPELLNNGLENYKFPFLGLLKVLQRKFDKNIVLEFPFIFKRGLLQQFLPKNLLAIRDK